MTDDGCDEAADACQRPPTSLRAHALGGRAATILDAVWRAGFVYGSAPTCHLAVQARTSGYEPSGFEDAVVKQRQLVRVRAMRGSVYLVPTELVPHALSLTRVPPPQHYAKLIGIKDPEPLARQSKNAFLAPLRS